MIRAFIRRDRERAGLGISMPLVTILRRGMFLSPHLNVRMGVKMVESKFDIQM
jgi:hypothetical protein